MLYSYDAIPVSCAVMRDPPAVDSGTSGSATRVPEREIGLRMLIISQPEIRALYQVCTISSGHSETLIPKDSTHSVLVQRLSDVRWIGLCEKSGYGVEVAGPKQIGPAGTNALSLLGLLQLLFQRG